MKFGILSNKKFQDLDHNNTLSKVMISVKSLIPAIPAKALFHMLWADATAFANNWFRMAFWDMGSL